MKSSVLVPIYVRVDAALVKRLDKLAETGLVHCKRTTMVRNAIELGIAELEKRLRAK